MILGCLADDFTGASDLCGLIQNAGFQVTLHFGVPDDGVTASQNEVHVIALKSRTNPVDEAIADSLAAMDWLVSNGAERIFFKYCSTFDSTPDGNIGPVSEALAKALGASGIVYAPSFPLNKRTVYMGHLFVADQLISDSPMKDHPLTPMTEPDLRRHLSSQLATPESVGLLPLAAHAGGAEGLRSLMVREEAAGRNHFIADAVEDADLDRLGAALVDRKLATGGSAFGAAWARGLHEAGLIEKSAPVSDAQRVPGGQLSLAGSCSEMTRAQVEHYLPKVASLKLDPLELARDGSAKAVEWLTHQDPAAPKLIYATADPEEVRHAQSVLGKDVAGQVVEDAMGDIAQAALASGIRRIVVAGGETSGAVVKALGIRGMNIGSEIAPGVPCAYTKTEMGQLGLALKSGNFGGVDFFSRAQSMLEAGA